LVEEIMKPDTNNDAFKTMPPGDNPANSTTRYDEPFGWWGYHWTPPNQRSLIWLMQAGALDARLAAFLSLAIALHRTVVVVAEPNEAGKTTLLTALLDFRQADTEPIYLRGWYERFSFLDTVPPERAYLLCNEISAHLPTYLWGQGVRRVFEAGMGGYAFVTTMHASSAADAAELLIRYPLEVPERHLRTIDLVVTLNVGQVNNKPVRRVTRVERFSSASDPFRIEQLSERPLLRSDLEHRTGRMIGRIAEWAECDDSEASRMLSRREHLLQSWLKQGIVDIDAVRQAILSARSTEP
jgi:hypothetical protein